MAWSYNLGELARVLGVSDPGAGPRFTAVSKDTRSLPKEAIYFALAGENFDGEVFVEEAFKKGAAAAVTKKAHGTHPCLVVDDPLRALQQFAAHHRARYSAPVIALTGSCGKTTAKEYLAALLDTKYRVIRTVGNLNNEIGCPLSLLGMDGTTEMAVIEMGANHVGEVAALCRLARPTDAAVTMVAPAHLEGFGSIEGVAEAKGEIAEGLVEGGVFYVNTDDPWCRWIGDRYAGPTLCFGSSGDVVLRDCALLDNGEYRLDIDPVGTLQLPLPVAAYATNVLLAVAVAQRHGVTDFEGPLRAACATGARFRVLAVGGIEVLDDSYNANPASMTAALGALAQRKAVRRFAALGEMLELGDAAPGLHRAIGETAVQCGVDGLFARGPHACDMIESARAAGIAHAEVIEDHHAMAHAIHACAQAGDALLVKGSRGMRMERVIEALRTLVASGEGG